MEGSQSGWRKACFSVTFATTFKRGLGSERPEVTVVMDGRVTVLALAWS
jgi:hypothetical protein